MRDPRSTAGTAEAEEATVAAAADRAAATLGGGGAKLLHVLVGEHRHEGGMHAIEITAETPPLHRA
jgi:hypothetical protein